MFAHDMNWTTDSDLACDQKAPRRALLQLCMYTMHLMSGSTLFCRRIRLSTIKLYISAAASLVQLLGESSADPRKHEGTDKTHPILASIFAEYERWEKQPNRREPLTLEMLSAVERRAATTTCKSVTTSLLPALCDWFECGLYAGFRLSEWAQDSTHSDVTSPALNLFGDPTALCLPDVTFATTNNKKVTALAALQHPPAHIVKCWITFRTQKNGDHGEKKLFTQNPGGRSFVHAMLRIIRRFVELRGPSDVTTPLALYRCTKTKTAKFITSTDIEYTLQTAAIDVYGLDIKKDAAALKLWSAHSIRVGACVILHVCGCTDAQIQFFLRWRSRAFMVYLRNVAALSNVQNSTMNKAEAMPNFF